jgi:hypothetical protein
VEATFGGGFRAVDRDVIMRPACDEGGAKPRPVDIGIQKVILFIRGRAER